MSTVFNIFQLGLQQGFIWGIAVIGVYISFRILDFADLSIEGSFPFGGCISAILIYAKVNPFVAIIISVIGGLLAGLLTGILHTKFKIPGILSGIITMTALASINLLLLGWANGFLKSSSTLILERNIFNTLYDSLKGMFDTIGLNKNISIKIIKFIVSGLFLLIAGYFIYWLFGTEIGMNIRATGNNIVMSKSQGISTDNMTILGLMLSNGLIALSGALFVNDSGAANSVDGKGAIVICLAAIIIGEVIFTRKRSFKISLISIIIGCIIFFIIKNIAISLKVQHFLDLLTAILLIVILALPTIKERMALSKKKGLSHVRD